MGSLGTVTIGLGQLVLPVTAVTDEPDGGMVLTAIGRGPLGPFGAVLTVQVPSGDTLPWNGWLDVPPVPYGCILQVRVRISGKLLPGDGWTARPAYGRTGLCAPAISARA